MKQSNASALVRLVFCFVLLFCCNNLILSFLKFSMLCCVLFVFYSFVKLLVPACEMFPFVVLYLFI